MKHFFLSLLFCCGFALFATQAQTVTSYQRSTSVQPPLTDYLDPQLYPFYHGVASGDPLVDRVIIWTRVSPEEDQWVSGEWRIATDPDMQNVVQRGPFITGSFRDYTVKIDVTQLAPATTYYYQFSALDRQSIVGRTRTAPEQADELNFAVVSCSNYQAGFFNAYRQMAQRSDLDAVIHLGDYIYEYEDRVFASEEVDRPILPENEIVSRDDYRVRYSFYRLDPDLRAVHQQHPFITVWDDHEFANDAYKDGAQNHQRETEGRWQQRKLNAWGAYFEWMPVRETGGWFDRFRVYRKISYGNLVDLLMLDTRITGRDEQLDDPLEALAPARTAFKKAYASNGTPNEKHLRSLLRGHLPQLLHVTGHPGAVAEKALSSEEFDLVVEHIAAWVQLDSKEPQDDPNYDTVSALVRRALKEPFAASPNSRTEERHLLGDQQFAWLERELAQSQAQWKILGNQVLLFPVIGAPFVDTWDGYPDDRQRLVNFLEKQNIQNVAVVTGDIHATFTGDLPTDVLTYAFNPEASVAVEFVTPSVTSANFDEILSGLPTDLVANLALLLNPHIKDLDLTNHGYMVLNVTPERIRTDWYYMNDILQPGSGEFLGKSWSVRTGENRLQPADSTSRRSTATALAPTDLPNAEAPYAHGGMVLVNAYPNPADQVSGVHLALNRPQNMGLRVYDAQGNIVREIAERNYSAGSHYLQFSTQTLPEGLYVVEAITADKTSSRRLLIRH